MLLLLAMSSCHQNPFLSEWTNPYGIPNFENIRTSDYMKAVKAGIEAQKAEIKAITDNPEAPTFENTVAAFDRSGAILERVGNILMNVSESDATDEINAIVGKAMPLFSEHGDNIMMDKALYERVKTVYEN